MDRIRSKSMANCLTPRVSSDQRADDIVDVENAAVRAAFAPVVMFLDFVENDYSVGMRAEEQLTSLPDQYFVDYR